MTIPAALMAGAMLGLSVAVPFGPVSLMCVQRSMTIGRNSGFITGLGAASANGLFAFAAMAGAQVISAQLAYWDQPLRQFSAVVLVALGIRSWRRRPVMPERPASISSRAAYSSTLILALSNPLTILPYAAVASSVAFSDPPGSPLSFWSVLGVMLGSITWYVLLSVGSAHFCKSLSAQATRRLNQLAGTGFVTIGVLLLTR